VSVARLKRRVPWPAKLAAKLLLARLPLEHGVWRRLSLFQHGEMADPAYADDVFQQHFGHAERLGVGAGFVGLELGPGDTVSSALLARVAGASRCYLVDVAPFAVRELEPYRALAGYLHDPELAAADSFDQLLERTGGDYRTEGLASLRSLPAASVDFAWSHAVLEHVRRDEFDETARELRRVVRPGGVVSHRIDLRDHLADGLHSLRFPERVWESSLFRRSGFYTNRLRCSELLASFERAGFEVETVEKSRWPQPRLPRSRLAKQFRSLSDDDLLVFDVAVVLRPA
jgi:SAM-dependent methyltransferase